MVLVLRWCYPLIRPLASWGIRRFGVPQDGVHPRWWCWLVDRSFDIWEQDYIRPRLLAADATGQGLTWEIWAAATDPQTIIDWYDNQIHQSSHRTIMGLNWFRIFLIQCTEAEAQQAQATGLPLSADHLLVEWTGHRSAWWTEGRHQIQEVLTTDHNGLYTVVNSAAAVHQAALQSLVPSLNEVSSSQNKESLPDH